MLEFNESSPDTSKLKPVNNLLFPECNDNHCQNCHINLELQEKIDLILDSTIESGLRDIFMNKVIECINVKTGIYDYSSAESDKIINSYAIRVNFILHTDIEKLKKILLNHNFFNHKKIDSFSNNDEELERLIFDNL